MGNVVVVGAGAAGIIAAWRAACLGAKVTLLEKTPRIGTKILISGGGKCNITHDGPLEDLLSAFRRNEARFIKPACYRFTNRQVVEMLTTRGLRVYTRPDGRIFPVDQTAKDVVAILRRYLDDAGVEVRLDTPVTRMETLGDGVTAVVAGEKVFEAKTYVVSTGGSSYPNSGTTGDGWKWLKELGHEIVKVRAALAPLYLEDVDPSRSGVALRDVVLKARQDGKEIDRWRGDLLFTHHGISGPTALGVSRVVAERMGASPISLQVDLLPDRSFEELTSELLFFTQNTARKRLSSFLEAFMPERLAPDLLARAQISAEAIGANLEKKGRNRLIETIKAWPIGVVRHVPLEKGEVVAGGVSLEEVDSQSMRSKRLRNLFLCGEVLDIAGPVGGYNLQAAFATGYVAGESAYKESRDA